MSKSVECTCSKQESYFPIPWGGGGGGGVSEGSKIRKLFSNSMGEGGGRGV